MADRTCTTDGCHDRHVARGLCAHHYRLARYHGTLPERTGPTTPHAAVLDVAIAYDVPIVDLLDDSRTGRDARVAAAHRLRDLGCSWADAAHVLGDRDRQQVRYLASLPVTPPAGPPTVPGPNCTIDGCGRPAKFTRAQLCAGHYQRWRRDGQLRPDVPLRAVLSGDGPILDLDVHDRTGYRNGCRCEVCRADAVRAVKLNRHRPALTGPGPAVAHLEALASRGMTPAAAARAAGVNHAMVYSWLNGRTKQALRTNVAAVCAVPLPCEECDAPALGGGRWCRNHITQGAARLAVAS